MAYSSWMAAANNIPEPEPVEPERGGFVSQTVSRPQGVVRTGAASSGSLLGDVARIGRRVVPQGVRDTLGSAARATFAELQSGEALGNEMVPKYKGKPIGGFTPGTDIGEQIGRIPRVGRVLRTAADIAGAPATWGTAGIGPGAQASFKALPLAARVPLNIAAPASRSANFGVRLGAETAIGTAATVGAQETAKRTDNPWLVAGAGLGAGVLASGAVTAAPRTMRAAAKGATTYRDLTENIPVGMSVKKAASAADDASAVLSPLEAARREADDTVTLYRGQGASPHAPGSGYAGRWFTPDKALAESYSGGQPVQSVQVPRSIAERVQVPMSAGRPVPVDEATGLRREVLLPKEWAALADPPHGYPLGANNPPDWGRIPTPDEYARSRQAPLSPLEAARKGEVVTDALQKARAPRPATAATPPPGMVRLYRGATPGARDVVPGQSGNAGRWFTTDINDARAYARAVWGADGTPATIAAGDEALKYVDVPKDVVEAAMADAERAAGFSLKGTVGEREMLLPEEWAGKAVPVTDALQKARTKPLTRAEEMAAARAEYAAKNAPTPAPQASYEAASEMSRIRRGLNWLNDVENNPDPTRADTPVDTRFIQSERRAFEQAQDRLRASMPPDQYQALEAQTLKNLRAEQQQIRDQARSALERVREEIVRHGPTESNIEREHVAMRSVSSAQKAMEYFTPPPAPGSTTLQARFIPGLSPSSSTGAVLGAAGGYGSGDTREEKFRNALIGAGIGAAGGNVVGRRFPALNQGVKGQGDVLGAYVVPPSGSGKAASVTPLNSARTKILDATKREAQLRNSGVVDLEIGSGRTKQAAGIRAGVEGATGSEAIARARAGARVGQLRTILAEPIDLDEDEIGAILSETMRRQPGRDFSILQVGDIIDRLREGRGLQPAQIETVRGIFGKDVAESLSLRPASAEPRNITPAMIRKAQADLAAEAEAAPGAAAKRQTTANAREVNARMRELGEKAPPPPKPSDVAFERAALDPAAKWNEAQAPAINRARKQVEAWQKGQEGLMRQAARDLQRQADEITAMENLSTRNITAADTRELRGAEKVLRDAQREEARASATAAREARVAARAAKNYPTPDEIMRQVDAADLTHDAREVARQWVEANRSIIDRVETGGVFEPLRQVSATLKGDVKDSFLNAVLVRESLLADTLQKAGTTPETAKAVARALSERELLLRYGVSTVESLPTGVIDTLKAARNIPFENQLGGLVKLNQEAKATMFGIGDIGIFGQQVHTAVMNGGIPGLVGLVNRTAGLLHLPHVSTMLADSTLPRQLQHAVDGLDTGIASSGLTKGSGTLLRRVPKVGPAVDDIVTKIVDRYSEWQFGTVMGSVRNLMYEGNLVLAKATGADLSDPLVRAQAANATNHITSSAQLATNATRRQLESVAFTSAQMNRARFARINDMAKLLSLKATKEERMFAATVIASNVMADVVLGKVIHDMIGVGEFEADPSKPGFGKITTNRKDEQGRNIVWDYIPQDSIQRAFAGSLRALAEGSPEDAAKAWARAGIGAASPVGRLPLAGAGLSYTPGQGYGYLRDNATPADRLKNMIPVPPIASSLMRGENEPYQIASQVAAEGAYPESPTQAVTRPDFAYGTLKGEAQLEAVKPEAWRKVGGKEKTGADSYGQWYGETYDRLYSKFTGSGKAPAEADALARSAIENRPEYDLYNQVRNQMEDRWGLANPEEAAKVLDREVGLPYGKARLFTPSPSVRQYIDSKRAR